jgi:hypothetical protein
MCGVEATSLSATVSLLQAGCVLPALLSVQQENPILQEEQVITANMSGFVAYLIRRVLRDTTPLLHYRVSALLRDSTGS